MRNTEKPVLRKYAYDFVHALVVFGSNFHRDEFNALLSIDLRAYESVGLQIIVQADTITVGKQVAATQRRIHMTYFPSALSTAS